ncbi:acetolactate synthase small subunit [Corynebacterium incognita]|uniref:Acetolactate synthase small subunit n=1 Tax=Corynebacterium incognita TaxID=2754725 RepID=A0A7G7CPE3_9CORY|nr:acetolactate synthase small subunit [Corynebacterium incognita]QNE89459.1 acetolactate synthase small subunit [Corynebacterium incognita]
MSEFTRGTSGPAPEQTLHTIAVLVQDVEGITSRVTGMFSRRGFNIESLVSASTGTPGIQRLTLVAWADEHTIEQIIKQLHKLVPVLKVKELEGEHTVARALMLVKVSADATKRPQIVDAVNIFRGRVVDVAPDSVVIEATGAPGKLQALLDVLEPFGILELARSGHVALRRGSKVLSSKYA